MPGYHPWIAHGVIAVQWFTPEMELFKGAFGGPFRVEQRIGVDFKKLLDVVYSTLPRMVLPKPNRIEYADVLRLTRHLLYGFDASTQRIRGRKAHHGIAML